VEKKKKIIYRDVKTENTSIPYALIRTRRRTLAVKITEQGEVEVRAPIRLPLAEIEGFLREKEDWICRKSGEARKLARKKEKFSVTYGSLLRLGGDTYPLLASERKGFGWDGQAKCFTAPPGLDEDALKSGIIALYRDLARQYVTQEVRRQTVKIGVGPQKIRINSAASRWGSCSSTGNLNFSWRIIMADEGARRYIVIHEMCHLKEFSHAPDFWKLVSEYCPDYEAQRVKLDALSRVLHSENWTNGIK